MGRPTGACSRMATGASPCLREIGGILYVNDGDWVESCTAVIEHHDGRLEIIDWTRRASVANVEVAMPAAGAWTRSAGAPA